MFLIGTPYCMYITMVTSASFEAKMNPEGGEGERKILLEPGKK